MGIIHLTKYLHKEAQKETKDRKEFSCHWETKLKEIEKERSVQQTDHDQDIDKKQRKSEDRKIQIRKQTLEETKSKENLRNIRLIKFNQKKAEYLKNNESNESLFRI